MLQLSGQDASFVYLETPHTPMHIGSVGIYDHSTAPGGFVRFKDVLNFIGSRLGGARSFRQRLVRVPFDLDHPYWIEDPEFDIEFHVRHIAVPKPGDWRQLCIQVARLHARPMDLSKPLWELTIVEGLDNIPGLPPGCFALVSKVHHAAIDGMSGVEMSAAVHDLDASMPPPKTQDDWQPENMPNLADLLERLRFVHDAAVNSKAMTNAVGARTLSDYSQLIPSGLAGLAARLYTRVGAANAHAPVFNCVVTNVPGSRVPLYFCGAKMVAMYGTGPVFDGMGLINPIYSYGDTIAISFTSDRDMMPDPENYAAALRASFEALKEATLGAPAKQPAAPKADVPKKPATKAKPKPTPAAKKPAAAGRKPAPQKKG